MGAASSRTVCIFRKRSIMVDHRIAVTTSAIRIIPHPQRIVRVTRELHGAQPSMSIWRRQRRQVCRLFVIRITDGIIVLALRSRRVAVTSRLFPFRDSRNWKDFKQPAQQNVIVMVARWSQS
jgi:hypothetical protein